MRYILALTSLILGVLLLLAGLVQRVMVSSITDVRASTDLTVDAPYTVISADELSRLKGNPRIDAGNTAGVMTLGRMTDVIGWVEPYGYTQLHLNADATTFTKEKIDPVKPKNFEVDTSNPTSPVGSDLWIAEVTSDGSERLEINSKVDSGDAILITGVDGEKLGSEITVAWGKDRYTPWAGPSLLLGGILTALGALLYIIFVDRDRRGLGPQRGNRGALLGIRSIFSRKKSVDPIYSGGQKDPSKRGKRSFNAVKTRRLALPALLVTGGLMLSGCSADYWVQLDRNKQQDIAVRQGQDTLSQSQIQKIIKQVAKVSQQADIDLDENALAERFNGSALEQRAANYKIRTQYPEYSVVPPYILDERLEYELVQSTKTWPRTMFITVASSSTPPGAEGEVNTAASPSLALLLTQENAHSNYMVKNIFALRGGIKMPAAAAAEEGTALLDPDISTVKLQPQQVAAEYSKILLEGAESAAATNFNLTDDALITSSGKSWIATEQSRAAEQAGKATYTVTIDQSETPPVAISTGAGGALVAATIYENRITEADSGSELPVGNVVAAISGMEGKKKRIVQRVSHQLLFFVPAQSADAQIQLLGSSSELIGASE